MLRDLLCSLAVVFGFVQTAVVDHPKPIAPQEARDHLDEHVVVTMEVVASKYSEKRTTVFLDSEADFRDPKNLGITIGSTGIKDLKEKKRIDSPAEHFRGRTIRVTGTVTTMEDRFYIHVEKAEQIDVVERKE